jgi:hypothetical protein
MSLSNEVYELVSSLKTAVAFGLNEGLKTGVMIKELDQIAYRISQLEYELEEKSKSKIEE